MSADEVLASHLWPWPDPLLKRNQAGQVMFVNAAFLQLYGGQVHDWCGKPLMGWPDPVFTGAQRFETRTGSAPDEFVFDWVESVLADGNTLAIARNVTVFVTAPAPQTARVTPPSPEPQLDPQNQTLSHPPVLETQPTAAAANPAFENSIPAQPDSSPVVVPGTQDTAPDISDELEDTLNKRADEYAYDDNKSEPTIPASAVVAPPVADQISQEAQSPEATPAAKSVPNPVADIAPVAQDGPPAPVTVATPQLQDQEDERMIERRALPIKDSASVLGSNWRDQVIAKAVGDPTASEDEDANSQRADILQDDKEDEAPKPGEGLHILLAEDNAINALLTRTLLEAEGAEVDTVEDGALALDAVGKKKYDLIFMDMRMPNMDGLESTRKIRAFGYKGPIIALTANAFDDDRNACFDSGMNDFMTKPVSAEELSEMVVNWTKDDAEKKLAS